MRWDHVAHEEGTDKARFLRNGADAHGYADIYQRYLPETAETVLELGVDEGASLRMWGRIWPAAHVVGIDLHERERRTGGAEVRIGDATDQRFLEMVARDRGQFDVIVDDASHRPDDVVMSYRALIGWVAAGGWYCVEDLYWPEALEMLPRLANQRIARVVLEPDAVSAARNILGPLVILIQVQ